MIRPAAWALLAITVLATGAGLYGRLAGLGARPLAIDEYYFVKSVESIVEHGLPAMAGGGYYVRGLFPQYITAASVLALGDNGLAWRLPPVLFGLAALGLAYAYARRFAAVPVAAAIAASLAVSSWQIEFARFARMYAPFQCLTLLFLLLLDETFYRRRGRWPYAPHAVAILTTLTHTLGLLLTPLLFVPLVSRRLRERFDTRARAIEFAVVGVATTLLCYGFKKARFRLWGVTDRFPDDFVREASAGGTTLRPPGILLWAGGEHAWSAFAWAGLLCALAVAGLGLLRLRGRQVRVEDVLLVLVLAAGLTHQLLPLAACLAVLVLRFRILHDPGGQPTRTWVLLGAGAVAAVAWIVAVLAAPGHFTPDAAPSGAAEFARRVLLGWPDVYQPLFLPWWRELPRLTVLLIAALAVSWIALARQPIETIVRHPATAVSWIALCFGLLQSTYTSTRYAFFVYPLTLTVLALAVQTVVGAVAARRSAGAGRGGPMAIASIYLGLFALSGDFHPQHIRRVAGEDVTFRLGPFEPYAATWYVREDYPGAARIAAQQARPGDRVVVVDQPAVSYYLHREHAVYHDRRSVRFRNVSRKSGTVEVWSGLPLLSTAEDLRRYTRDAGVVWLVRTTDPARQRFRPRDVWPERIQATDLAGRSRDGRLEVLRVGLRPQGS